MDTLSVCKLMLYTLSSQGVVYLLLKTGYTLFTKVEKYFVKRQLGIEWYTYIDISVVSLSLTSIVSWFTIFIKTR